MSYLQPLSWVISPPLQQPTCNPVYILTNTSFVLKCFCKWQFKDWAFISNQLQIPEVVSFES